MEALQQTGEGQRIWRRDLYTLREIVRRNVKKFSTTGTDYCLQINAQPGQQSLLDQLGEAFNSVIRDMSEGMAEHDLVWIILRTHSLTYPISLPFMLLRDLTAEMIMKEVQRVLNSNEQVDINDGIFVHVVHVAMPAGGESTRKRKHYGFQMEKFLNYKGSIIPIKNKDKLCLARANLSIRLS